MNDPRSPSTHPSIVVVRGPEAGASLVIDEVLNDFSIGSDENCHLALSGASVSPLHATLFLDDEGAVTLSDTKSRGGVFVNGYKITEQSLNDGDEVSIGPPDDDASPRLRFVAGGKEAPLIDLPGLSDFPASDLETPGAPELSESLAPESPFGAAPAIPAFLPEPLVDEPAEAPAAEFVPLQPVPDAEPEPAPADEFPPPEAFLASEPSAEPEILPEPEPEPPAPEPPPVRPASPSAARKSPPARTASAGSGDPLAGLAESLGGGQRSAPPPPLPAVAPAAARAKDKGSRSQMAVRMVAVAVVLVGVAWFATRRYSESIVVPVIDSSLPNPAEPGQTVTIKGSGFGADGGASGVKVMLGSTELPVLDANPTRLNVTVPEGLGSAGSQLLPMTVSVSDRVSAKNQFRIVVAPKIVSLTPRVALSGDEVVIAGRWLATPKTAPVVTVGGAQAELLEATPERIRIKVPEVAAREGQKISVRVAVGADVGKEAHLLFGRLPFVESVSPERAFPGDLVTVAGLGLGGADVVVTVGGKSAVVLSSSDTELKVSVPGLRLSEGPGPRDLRVQADGRVSAPQPLEVRRESSALYSPRFNAEVLEDGRISISTELGPVMVLSGVSLSRQRAHDAVSRLNALVGQGRATRVQFGAADLSINGPAGPVLVVAPGDGSGSPRSLAALWAAQLTDRFDLFLQGRRPGRTVELSPDGKVFLDIFAAARRRSNEAGVPQGLLFSLDPSWTRSLASLASSPSYGSGEALALLDGYWSGAIEVPGAIQPRKVEFSLTATPSGLVGQRTSRQGRLSTDVSLTRLSYGKGEIRFSFVDSGEDLNYAGRLDGDQIEGSVSKASGARVGKLTLKLTR